MSKHISTVGYQIPGYSNSYIEFRSETSLADADIILFKTDIPYSSYEDGNHAGLTSYGDESSLFYKMDSIHWGKELNNALKAGKTVFLFLDKIEKFYLKTGTTEHKGRSTLIGVSEYDNYEFLSVDIGKVISATGKHIEFITDPIFGDFTRQFKSMMEYRSYLENIKIDHKVIYTSKDKTRVLGAQFKIGNGHLILLPMIEYNFEEFTEKRKNKEGKEESYWNKVGIKFGNQLVSCLINIDKALKQTSEITAPPDWALDNRYKTNEENTLEQMIKKEVDIVNKAKIKIETLNEKIISARVINGLLYEQGKPLEHAVIKALEILGYHAEGYDDGTLELDQIIISPEGIRYIGECEGKDNKDIDITKYRQLNESISADFARDEVQEKAFGILFGNPQRLLPPTERTLDFTQKCKIGAARDRVALIKTPDLFMVTKYLIENPDEDFKKKCRDTIHLSLGKVVEFPAIPTNI